MLELKYYQNFLNLFDVPACIISLDGSLQYGNSFFKDNVPPEKIDQLVESAHATAMQSQNLPKEQKLNFHHNCEHLGSCNCEIRWINEGQFILKIVSCYDNEILQPGAAYMEAPVMLITISESGKILNYNRSTQKKLQVSEKELIGSPFHLIFSDNSQTRIESLLLHDAFRSQISGIPVQVNRWGSDLNFSLSASPQFTNEGELKSVICVLTDISENRKIRADLKNNERKLFDTQILAEVGEFYSNEKYGLIEINAVASEILGIGQRCIEISTMADLVKPFERTRLSNFIKNLGFLPDTLQKITMQLSTAGEKWITLHAKSQRDHNGILTVTGSIQDITKLMRLRLENQRAFERLGDLEELSETGIWENDLIKDELFVSEMAKKQLGLRNEEVDIYSKVYPEDREKLRKMLHGQMTDDTSLEQFEFRVFSGDTSKVLHARCKVDSNKIGVPLRVSVITREKSLENEATLPDTTLR